METVKTSLGDLPVNFGMNTLAMFSEMRDLSMTEVINLDYTKLTLMDIMALLYAGLKDGARKAKEDCKIDSVEDFNDFTEDNPGVVAELKDIFTKQQGQDKETEGEGKKK